MYMNPPNKIVIAALFLCQIAFLSPCRASDVVTIDAKYKRDSVFAPDPEYPIKSQHLGHDGQGIYRLMINEKTGVADEVKVLRTTGYRDLDATAVMTLFKWKFRPGAVKQRDVLVVFHLTGWSRGLH
jgi:TonB family protein